MKKICKRCSEPRSVTSFSKNDECSDGRGQVCRKCRAEAVTQKRQENHNQGLCFCGSPISDDPFCLEHQLKVCSSCHLAKHRKLDFYEFMVSSDGLRTDCTACVSARHKNWRYAHLERYLLKAAKSRARQRGIPFEISVEDVVIPSKCPILGLELDRTPGIKETSPSLDCILGERGYIPNNVQVISFRANRIKSDASLKELEAIVHYIRGAKQDVKKLSLRVRRNLQMTGNKLAAQCAHAAIGLYKKDPQKHWRCVVLDASDKKFEEAKIAHPEAYVVRDAGLTEVPSGSETVMGWWEEEQ